VSGEVTADDVLPSSGEDALTVARGELFVSKTLDVGIVPEKSLVLCEPLREVSTDSGDGSRKEIDEVRAWVEGAMDVLVTEAIDRLHSAEFRSGGRVEILEMSLKADHATLTEEEERDVSNFAGDEERDDIEFTTLGNGGPDFPGIGIEPFTQVLVLATPDGAVDFDDKIERTGRRKVWFWKASEKTGRDGGAVDGGVNDAFEDVATELIAVGQAFVDEVEVAAVSQQGLEQWGKQVRIDGSVERGLCGRGFRNDVDEFLVGEAAKAFSEGHGVGTLVPRPGLTDFSFQHANGAALVGLEDESLDFVQACNTGIG
jgi:hypothetical protein